MVLSLKDHNEAVSYWSWLQFSGNHFTCFKLNTHFIFVGGEGMFLMVVRMEYMNV